MKRFRAWASAAVLFVGIIGSMGTFGALIFEETLSLALYGAGVTAGAAWLSLGAYRHEVAAQEGRG
ncbi:hypothetical protein SLNSH_19895 [Alsobacter soli]|uniref:Uncharacterized protein n=1 Tax=Alsobacter soli TaxID=2109933 RepID=A0A2T1HNV9_9HYPH|nr:hypothetical protein [Alsobacter soli]PSC03209.1 hypothetical protein SLNSH_19895 [Alsobacter soli]